MPYLHRPTQAHLPARAAISGGARRSRLPLVALMLSLLAAVAVQAASSAALVKDINTSGALIPNNSSTPQHLTVSATTLYFSADDGTSGRELWKSDGTTNGTKRVKNIATGSTSSDPGELTDLNGTLLFTATTVLSGTELWRSDGTTNGTIAVTDINPAPGASSSPAELTVVTTVPTPTLFFSADDGTNGRELWKSRGIASDTQMVADINPVPGASSNPHGLTDMNGTLFFAATTPLSGTELWKSDGTPAGTVVVADINVITPAASSSPADLTRVGTTLFFTADDGANGVELWKSDGSAAGTVIVKDINTTFPGASSSPANLTAVGDTLFFTANDGVSGVELWKSDGSMGGTVRVKDIHLGAADSSPANLTDVDGTLFFTANDGIGGIELWKSDGTEAGTIEVKDIYPGVPDSSPADLLNVNGVVLFSANDGTSGRELWKSRGSSDTTVLMQDIASGVGDGDPAGFARLGSSVLFRAADTITGSELWSLPLASLNYAPAAISTTLTTALDTPITGTLNATDSDGDPLTFSLVANGSKGVAQITDATTGAFTYTPNSGAYGTDSFTFKANDRQVDSNIATVTILIGNHAPVAADGTVMTAPDTPVSGTLGASDQDSDPLTFSLVANGSKGVAQITDAATGAFTYTPNSGTHGSDSFTFKVNDGQVDSNVATISVTIGAPNHPPVANDITVATRPGAAISGTLSASDQDGDPLTFSLVANGSKGVAQVTDVATGAFMYTPNAGASGSDSFTFKVSDGQADSNIAIVTVTISGGRVYLPLVRK